MKPMSSQNCDNDTITMSKETKSKRAKEILKILFK